MKGWYFGTMGSATAYDTSIPYQNIPVQVLAAPHPNQLPINVPWNTTENDSNTWVPATRKGDRGRVSGIWLGPDPALAIRGIKE